MPAGELHQVPGTLLAVTKLTLVSEGYTRCRRGSSAGSPAVLYAARAVYAPSLPAIIKSTYFAEGNARARRAARLAFKSYKAYRTGTFISTPVNLACFPAVCFFGQTLYLNTSITRVC